MAKLISKIIIWIVAAFYFYGALVHVANILGLTGFNWLEAPLKWQALDVVYLLLDVIVVTGFLRQWLVGYVAFYVASTSQIILYTALRDWIIDVPQAFARSSEEIAYLDHLVVFHAVTLVLVSVALWLRRNRER